MKPNSLKKKSPQENNTIKKLSFFDHVKHIRQEKDPLYYINLSNESKKTFNHFMILRALSMDNDIVDVIALLYQVSDKIPSAQFYQLLIKLVPTNTTFYPWIKSRGMSHNKILLEWVAKKFKVSMYQAREYVNILIRSDSGQLELIEICKSFGLEDKEIEKLFDEVNYEKNI